MNLFDFSKIEDSGKLLKYRQGMLWVSRACMFSSVGLGSGAALGVTFGFNKFEIIILLVSCSICAVTILPSFFFFVFIEEIETVLIERGFVFDHLIGKRIQGWAVKMMLWFAAVIVLPIVISKLSS